VISPNGLLSSLGVWQHQEEAIRFFLQEQNQSITYFSNKVELLLPWVAGNVQPYLETRPGLT